MPDILEHIGSGRNLKNLFNLNKKETDQRNSFCKLFKSSLFRIRLKSRIRRSQQVSMLIPDPAEEKMIRGMRRLRSETSLGVYVGAWMANSTQKNSNILASEVCKRRWKKKTLEEKGMESGPRTASALKTELDKSLFGAFGRNLSELEAWKLLEERRFYSFSATVTPKDLALLHFH